MWGKVIADQIKLTSVLCGVKSPLSASHFFVRAASTSVAELSYNVSVASECELIYWSRLRYQEDMAVVLSAKIHWHTLRLDQI